MVWTCLCSQVSWDGEGADMITPEGLRKTYLQLKVFFPFREVFKTHLARFTPTCLH